MFEELYQFLLKVFPNAFVALAYSDEITKPGLGCIYRNSGETLDLKDLEGTTYVREHTFVVELWHDSLQEALASSEQLFQAAEGTKFQTRSRTPAWRDGLKRKWHIDIEIKILEDVE